MSKPFIPEVGTTCPGLVNEDYETMFSNDCLKFCLCAVTDRGCHGRFVSDSEDASSQFFSRARCHMNQDGLDSCPMYGMPPAMFVDAIQIKARNATVKKIAQMKGLTIDE